VATGIRASRVYICDFCGAEWRSCRPRSASRRRHERSAATPAPASWARASVERAAALAEGPGWAPPLRGGFGGEAWAAPSAAGRCPRILALHGGLGRRGVGAHVSEDGGGRASGVQLQPCTSLKGSPHSLGADWERFSARTSSCTRRGTRRGVDCLSQCRGWAWRARVLLREAASARGCSCPRLLLRKAARCSFDGVAVDPAAAHCVHLRS